MRCLATEISEGTEIWAFFCGKRIDGERDMRMESRDSKVDEEGKFLGRKGLSEGVLVVE